MGTNIKRDGPLAVLSTRVRLEERMIFAALERRGIAYESVNDRSIVSDLQSPSPVTDY